MGRKLGQHSGDLGSNLGIACDLNYMILDYSLKSGDLHFLTCLLKVLNMISEVPFSSLFGYTWCCMYWLTNYFFSALLVPQDNLKEYPIIELHNISTL